MHMSAAVNAVADDAAVGAAAASEIEELYMAAWADNALVQVLMRTTCSLFGPTGLPGWRKGLYNSMANRAWRDERDGVVSIPSPH